LGTTADRLWIAALLVVCALYCITPVYSENLFWHLRNGEDILDTHTVRTEDPFTWTMHGHRWIQQEWLAEVAFAAAWRAGGAAGLTVLKGAVVLSSVLLAALAARRRGAGGGAIAATAVVWLALSQARWFERPHIFTDLFFALYLFLLAGRRRSPWREMAVFLPLQVLWVNTHAGFVMGVFLLSLPAIDEAFRRSWRPALERLLLPFAALLASGIHPNGFRSLEYLPSFLAQPLFRETIREWWSPFDPRYGADRVWIWLIAASALTAALLVIRRRQLHLKPSEAVMLCALLVASLFAARNMELLALAVIAAAAPAAAGAGRLLPAVLLAAAAVIPPTVGLPRDFGPPRVFGTGMSWGIYPVGVSDFIEANGLYGRLFNTNEISGYLEYRFGERLPLYMDGRCLLYPQEFYAEYLLLSQMPDSMLAARQLSIIDGRGIQLAVYDWPRQAGSSANLLAELPGWSPVYWDELTVLYARLDYLDSIGMARLAFELADPLSLEELVSRPLYTIPDRSLTELTGAAAMSGTPEVVRWAACCILVRQGLQEEALELASASSDTASGEALMQALRGERPEGGYSPQVTTLAAWSLARSGRFEQAAEVSSSLGDDVMADAMIIAGSVVGGSAGSPGGPPPWVPEAGFSEWTAGGMPAQDSLAVVASALFASGLESEALECALSCVSSTGGHPWSLGVSAVVLAAAGRDSLGRAAAEQAVRANRNPCTLTLAGHAEVMAGRYADAACFYRAAVSIAPASPALRIDLASALWNSGELAGSAEQYEAAAGLGADLPPSGVSRLGWARVICVVSPLLDTPGRGGQF
jgi:hypothetical protein